MPIITNSRICLALLIIIPVRNRTHFLVIIISSILTRLKLILLVSKITTLFHRAMPLVLNKTRRLVFKKSQILLTPPLLNKLHKLPAMSLSNKDKACSIYSPKSNRTNKLITVRIFSLINLNKMHRTQLNRIPKVSRSLSPLQ